MYMLPLLHSFHHPTCALPISLSPQIIHPPTLYYEPQIGFEINPQHDQEGEKKCKKNVVMVSWELPPFMTFKLNTDGCSKGNPGESGSGGIIRDFAGRFVAGFSFRIGFECAAYAEIWALYQGLMLARKTTRNAVLWIECDSIEVVSVILGQHGDNYRYIDIVESCRQILKSFKSVNIRHVYREANRCADYLANKSLSHDMGLKEWKTPDLPLQSLIRDDQMGMATPRVCNGLCKPRFYK